MSGIKLSYHIDMSEPIRAFRALGDADRYQLADTIGATLVTEFKLNFENEQGPDGTPWTPSERAKNEGGKTLRDKNHLNDSITHNVFSGGDGVEVGSNMVYAAIHQFGGETGRNGATKIEARPYLGLNADIEDEIVQTTLNFYEQVLRDVR